MASTLHKYSAIKLYLKCLQILIITTTMYPSGSVVVTERPIHKVVEEFLVKSNNTDETYVNVKKYLDEVENVKAEFNQKKVFDMSSVLKLLESVDVSLLTDIKTAKNDEDSSSDEMGARNFHNFHRNNILRSVSSSKPLTENLIKIRNVYERFFKHKKTLKDAVEDSSSGIYKAHEVNKDRNGESSGEQVSTHIGTIADITKQDRYISKSLPTLLYADNAFNKSKEYSKQVNMGDSSETNYLEKKIQYFIELFKQKNVFNNGIQMVYNQSDIIEIAFKIKKQIFNDRNVLRISTNEKARQLISVFPQCLQTIIDSNAVCFLNAHYGVYLSAFAEQYDEEKRLLLAWNIPEHPGERGEYIVKFIGDNRIHIRNYYFNEYVHASNIWYRKDRRLVMQLLNGTQRNGSVWRLQLENNECSFLNEEYNEYLCLDEDKQDKTRKYTFTCPNNIDGKTKFKIVKSDHC